MVFVKIYTCQSEWNKCYLSKWGGYKKLKNYSLVLWSSYSYKYIIQKKKKYSYKYYFNGTMVFLNEIRFSSFENLSIYLFPD